MTGRLHKKRHNFSIIDNSGAEDVRLSYKARGLLWYILTKPDGWEVRMTDLIAKSDKDQRQSVQGAIEELEQIGYVVRWCDVNQKGQIQWHTEVFEALEDAEEWKQANPETYASRDKYKKKPANKETVNGLTASGKPVNGSAANGEPGYIVNTDLVNTNKSMSGTASSEAPHAEVSSFGKEDQESAQTFVGKTKPAASPSPTPPRPRRKKPTADEVYAATPHLDRFEKLWEGYRKFCAEFGASPGDKVGAAIAWKELIESGVSIDEDLRPGVSAFYKQSRARSGCGIPHLQYFLAGSIKHPTPYWKAAIEAQTSTAIAGENPFEEKQESTEPEPAKQQPKEWWLREQFASYWLEFVEQSTRINIPVEPIVGFGNWFKYKAPWNKDWDKSQFFGEGDRTIDVWIYALKERGLAA